ncbi:MAG TPA: NAD(P)H-hydrate dehydratase [Symbiobacteriaceae bacterium]|nr:NAD(P)H-hydrate dehydratase [Symbiobacteriaceae bacterium]
MKVVSAEQMRSIENRVFTKYGIPSGVVMEIAGRQVAVIARRLHQEKHNGNIVVVCGKGNNGGDGLVAARWLRHWDLPVQAVVWSAFDDLPPDAQAALHSARMAGVQILMPAQAAEALHNAGLIIDAVLGTGSVGSARGLAAEAIKLINQAGRPVLAVDIPSGVTTDTGKADGPAVRADYTVTFGLPKLGLFQFPGADLAGKVIVADIGLSTGAVEGEAIDAELTRAADVKSWLPSYSRNAHKGTRGRVLMAAASRGMTGAAALAGEAALRVGAGLVYVAAPESSQPVVAALRPEFMTVAFPESPYGGFAEAAAEPFLARAARADALAVGPGLGTDPEVQAFVRRVVANSPAPLVIDADAIKAFSGQAALLAEAPVPLVLTPHPGEMAHLLGISVEAAQSDRFSTVRQAAQVTKAVVLLKGAYTLIAEPGGVVWINPTGNRALGTGGSGDVLTGIIAGLLAQGMGAQEAAVAGAYMHGLAGDRLAAVEGEDGVLAGDLADELPRIQKDLRAGLSDSFTEFWG